MSSLRERSNSVERRSAAF